VNALPADLAHDLWPWSHAAGVLPASPPAPNASQPRPGEVPALLLFPAFFSRASSFSGVFFRPSQPFLGGLNLYIAAHSLVPTLPHSTGARIHSNSWNFDKVWTYDINAVCSCPVSKDVWLVRAEQETKICRYIYPCASQFVGSR